MANISTFDEQVRARSADWIGPPRKRFRWSTLRFEWGRWHYVVHPVGGVPDASWFAWERDQC